MTRESLLQSCLKAIRNGDDHQGARLVADLVDSGFDVNAYAKEGDALLHLAAYGKPMPQTINILINAGANIEAKARNMEETPLIFAAEHGHPDNVLALLRRGASVEAKGLIAYLPLHLALFKNSVPKCGLLMAYGAKLDPFCLDLIKNRPSLKEETKTALLSPSRLHSAVYGESQEAVQHVLTQGVSEPELKSATALALERNQHDIHAFLSAFSAKSRLESIRQAARASTAP